MGSNLNGAFAELSTRLKDVQHWNHLTLFCADSLWQQKGHVLSPDFINSVTRGHHADIGSVDFMNAPQSAQTQISKWIEQKTRGRIKDALPPAFTSDTKLVLCDAIYFKGKWASQFKRSKTRDGKFYVNSNFEVTVPMMNQKARFKSFREDISVAGAVELLEMPYFGRDLSMVIVLPQEKDGLESLEERLNPDTLQDWLKRLDGSGEHEIQVAVPRFHITQLFDVKQELQKLGVKSLFDHSADLSRMDGTKNLYLSDVLHNAFVDVNEEGTEAAAVTVMLAKTKGMAERFDADHPFIFLIREKATGSILFLGRMVDPTKQ